MVILLRPASNNSFRFLRLAYSVASVSILGSERRGSKSSRGSCPRDECEKGREERSTVDATHTMG